MRSFLVAAIAIITIFSLEAHAINTVADGYQVGPLATTRIYAGNGSAAGACYKVANTDASKSIFVPTKNTTDWSAFITNKPAYVTLTACYPLSCYEIKTVTATTTSNYYTIDSDGDAANASYSAYCDMTTDGGGWTRVFNHNIAGGYFASTAEANETNVATPSANKYSIISRLADFVRSGKYEMKLNWPGFPKRNWWTQTSSPTVSGVTGYTAVAVESTSNFWAGLELSSTPASTYIDGSVGSGNWFYAIGSTAVWGAPGGVPAGDDVAGSGISAPIVELWIK